MKTCLTKSSILEYPNRQERYVVFTDASDQAAAAILTQEYKDDDDDEMKEMPIAYLSTQFSDTLFKLSTVVREGYAIYYAIVKWRHYLEDAEILLKGIKHNCPSYTRYDSSHFTGPWLVMVGGERHIKNVMGVYN